MKYFEWLDRIQLLNLKVWDFSFRSLFREYGFEFFRKVILKHPMRTIRGINHYRKSIKNESSIERISIHESQPESWGGGAKTIVGAGFCLKPLQPACLSGRANHDCFYFEHHLYANGQRCPDCCSQCAIRTIGEMARKAGNSFYIMTSARDILFDMLVPALEEKTFERGLYALCRYSFEPFRIALSIAGIEGCLFPYQSGDCRDYATWLSADNGFKHERTDIGEQDFSSIRDVLSKKSDESSSGNRFIKKGHVFYCQ